ncbi:MAG: hypothetical protein ACE5E5_09275 [Phycisphaerae bacterium]
MNKKTPSRRCVAALLLAGGCLLSGPCGITTLQFQDFATSSLIRTAVITVANLVEAATIQEAQNPDANAPTP